MRRRPVPHALLMAVAAALIAGCDPRSLLEDQYNGIRLEEPVTKPAIALERVDGTAYDVANETAGRPTFVYFGYSNCPDVCPIQLAYLAGGLRLLGADSASRVRVLVISIDPARDTGAVFSDWLRHFHPDFVPLRGARHAVEAEMVRLGLGVPPDVDVDTLSPDPAHASVVLGFTRDGMGRFRYPATTSPQAWAYDLRKLLADGSGPQ